MEIFGRILSYFWAVSMLMSLSCGAEFKDDVTRKQWDMAAKSGQKLLVVFYQGSKDCPTCQDLEHVISSLLDDQDLDEDLQMGESMDVNLASELGVTTFPAIVYLRENSHVIYDGKALPDSISQWIELSRSIVTQHLHDDSFEHLTQASSGATTGDWLVAFYCGSCRQSILPLIESVGIRIRQRTNVAVVDASKNKILADRFSIQKCPQIILFKQGKMYRYEIPKIDQPSLNSFVEVWYKNSRAETVLPPKSKFDYITEAIADGIKKQLQGENRILVLSAVTGMLAVVIILVLCCCCASGNKKAKYD